MTKKKGNALLMVWADVPADREPEFNRWYNEEHLAERLAVPGFLISLVQQQRRRRGGLGEMRIKAMLVDVGEECRKAVEIVL